MFGIFNTEAQNNGYRLISLFNSDRRKNFNEINDILKNREVDVSFLYKVNGAVVERTTLLLFFLSKGPLATEVGERDEGYWQVINLLLDLGSDIHYVDELGETPLYHCVCLRDYESVEKLLKMGTDPNYTFSNGKTVLDIVLGWLSDYSGIVSEHNYFLGKPNEEKISRIQNYIKKGFESSRKFVKLLLEFGAKEITRTHRGYIRNAFSTVEETVRFAKSCKKELPKDDGLIFFVVYSKLLDEELKFYAKLFPEAKAFTNNM